MMRKYIVSVLLFSVGIALAAQDFSFPEIKGFKKQTNYPVYTPANLWDFINGAAESYLAYDFVDLHVAEYKKGKDVIKVEVYKHKDNTMAFGIYSTERSPYFDFINLGTQGYKADGSINFLKGNYYVKIRTYSQNEKVLQAEQDLAQQLAAMLPGETSMPAVISQFPSEGKKVNEETYINESVLGHKFLSKAFRASYQAGNSEFMIFILDKPSKEETMNTVNAYLESANMDATDEDSGKYILKDGYNDIIFMSWKGNRIILISGLAQDQSDLAEQYTAQLLE
jgi:hypothetical protein